MCQVRGHSASQIALHQWRDQTVVIRLTNVGKRRSLEIDPTNVDKTNDFEPRSRHTARLRCAADIVLNHDAALSRLVERGRSIRIELNRPRPRIPRKIDRASQATLLRPLIEDLVAPLVFDVVPSSKLRSFQEFGVRWLVKRQAGILADDMGLGKTAQALRALQELILNGTILSGIVVCPKSLLANWELECSRWVPDLIVLRAVPPINEANEVWSAILGRAHIIITSYQQLRPIPKSLAEGSLDLVIADEAHRLRRSEAKVVKSFRLLKAERIWALTGTPIERHEVDLATLLSLLVPTRFSIRSASVGIDNLRRQARPFLLRRLKRHMLDELPDVIDTKELIELTETQEQAYALAKSKPLSHDIGEILKRFNLMRSICDLDPGSESSAKLDRIEDVLHAVQEAGEKAVVFSYLLRPLHVLAKRLENRYPNLGVVSLTGKLTNEERDRVLQEFKTEQRIVALLCSSRVGGEGLTLTEANHVIFINEWWNPSANDQARDRVVRLGQERIVHVHRFRCKGTIEESLERILKHKNETFTSVIDALVSKSQHIESQSTTLVADEIRKALLEPDPSSQ